MGPALGHVRSALRTVLLVRLGEERYALPLETVEEVWPALLIESVSQCLPSVRGVVFVRSRLVPILDAAERLGVRDHERPEEPPIVCLRVGQGLVGVEFHEVIDLRELDLGQALPAARLGVTDGLISSVVEQEGQIIRVLDPERFLTSEETLRLNDFAPPA